MLARQDFREPPVVLGPRGARRLMAAAVAGTLIGAMSVPMPGTATPARPDSGQLRPQVEKLDREGGEVHGRPWPQQRRAVAPRPRPVWPESGRMRIVMPHAKQPQSGGLLSTPATGLPIRVAPSSIGSTPAAVDVEILGRATAPVAWRDGVLMALSPVDPSAASTGVTSVAVSVDYSQLRYAYGGDWASRLRLWSLPKCALSTPEAPACQGSALRSRNNPAAGTVTADARLAPSGGGATLLALAADSSGATGDFKTTSLSPSATWVSGGPTGDFAWSYPMRTPPSPGGPAPNVTLAYSSSSVDGRSDATNNQPSWIGEGFEYFPGFIERRYVSCNQDMAGTANNNAKTGDLCWRSDNATMSLSGRAVELIFESGKGWHSRQEDGSRIEKLAGAANGDDNGEHWRVTTSDGTQYFFGLQNLPGYSNSTDSTWTAPVFGNHPNEPCHEEAFAKSSCAQAWRWNLDYVVDTRGNTMSYWYETETNKYAANITSTNDKSYIRGGALRRIDYGTWDRGSADRSTTATAQVMFDTADRCLSSCTSHDAAHWPDVPWDQECKADATSCGTKYSPTFWSTKRLTKITTKVWDTTRETPAWQDVDSWTLSHSFPSPGDGSDHAGLWLASITHAGHVGGTVTMPPVTFEPVSMPNRVLTDTNTTNNWQRIGNIVTETGAKVQITYSLPECTDIDLPAAPHNNTRLCYPVIGPDPYASDDSLITEWWHKYVVRQVSESDVQLAGGHQAPVKNTRYSYVGNPAWHYSDDDGVTTPKYKTWNQFRGYTAVKTRVGDTAGAQTLTETRYLRGMHGDREAPSGGTSTVTVGASIGDETVYDHDQFAGMVREQIVYNGTESRPVSKTVNVPWRSSARAQRTINGDTVGAYFVNTQTVYAATALGVDGARGWRTTKTESSFDAAYGSANWSQNHGDLTKTGDEQCTSYTYNRNTTKNITQTTKRVTTTALACSAAPASGTDIVSDERMTYDGAASPDTAPQYGNVTRTERLSDWSKSDGASFQTVSQATFDSFGRQLTETDIRGNTTTTAYSPPTGPVATITTTSPTPYNWTSTLEKTPYWGHTKRTVDPNGRATNTEYDSLGRVSKAWKIGWLKADHPETPSEQYTYYYSADRSDYPYVMAKTLNAAGGYKLSYQILDALMRVRQVQTAGSNGDRVVSDTIYDELGRMVASYDKHAEPGAPSGTLWWEPEWSLRTVKRTVYDNTDRPVDEIFLAGDGETNLVEKWRTRTRYEGDVTTVTPPEGGTPTTTVTDAQGRTVQLRQHTSANGVSGPYDATSYEYDRKNQLVRVTDPAGNEWTHAYDIKGRQTRSTDPDKGATSFEFNDFNEVVKATDARGQTLLYEYDQLGRKTALYGNTVSAATKRVEWKYDRLYTGATARGQLTETIRYEGTAAYKRQVVNFNARYQATGINYVIPYAETGLGGTYSFGFGFSPYDGSPESTTYPATGGLGGEAVTTVYDRANGLPLKLESNAVGVGGYIASQEYTAYGEPTLATRKTTGGVYVQDATYYDTVTRRVTRTTVKPETATGRIWDRRYEYDAVGNVLSIADSPEVGDGETQCFRYDGLRRLTTAWTPKAETTCDPDPAVASLGGPAPYWAEWTFDKIGNRLTEISHSTGGDTRRAYTVPASGAGVARPHAVTSVTTQAPGQATMTATYNHDATGNTVARPAAAGGAQALVWDPEGRLAEASDGSGTTRHVYDGDGNRLIRRDSTGTTLYLPGMEIRRASGASSNVAVRYYQFGGETIASRTLAGGLRWLYSDQQGTQQATVDAATQAVTVRRQTPYGAPRGAQSSWPNGKGFVGGDIDPSGLIHLGAREYDPILGAFLSVDPIVDFNQPQQMHAYAYGLNAPTTFSDPTGMRPPEMSIGEWNEYLAEQARESQNVVKTPPPVTNQRLENILRQDIYARPQAGRVLKDGKVATAVRNEFETGKKTGPQGNGKWHYEKAARAFAGLSQLLEDDRVARSKGGPGLLTPHDRAVAKLEAMELWNALNAEDTAGEWTRDTKSTPEGVSSREHTKNAIKKAANQAGMADVTGATYEQKVHGGRPVGRPVQKVPPRIRGAAGALGVVGDILAVADGLNRAHEACGSDCSALEVASHLMCAMIPGCDNPYTYPYPGNTVGDQRIYG